MKKKFIVVGTGNRGLGCFARKIMNTNGKGEPEFPEHGTVSALVDSNPLRAKNAARELGLPDLPAFKSIAEAQKQCPSDWCVITTPDYTHCEIAVEALQLGLNLMIDKPLATSVMECDKIISTMEKTGKKVIVGHNARYHENTLDAARFCREGLLGKLLVVEGAEMLGYNHGGDYFHRWHSDFSKSAGLITHKCCHFFDLICWILDDAPDSASAFGKRSYYVERPDMPHGKRCSECQIGKKCPQFYDMEKWDGFCKRMYKDAEPADGYLRDLCVFSDRHSICDHETMSMKFEKGTLGIFSYSTFSPKEHWYLNFTGEKGRIEIGANSWDGIPYFRMYRLGEEPVIKVLGKEGGEHGHEDSDSRLVADMLELKGSHPLLKALPWEARRAVMLCEMVARSVAADGRPVKSSETGKGFPPPPPDAGRR